MRVVKGVGDGPPTPFEHPFSQTAAMFTGELLCLAAYYISILPFWRRGKTASAAAASTSGEEGASLVENDGLVTDDDSQAKKKKPKLNPLILWIPACCDLGGTTLLNVGLFLVRIFVVVETFLYFKAFVSTPFLLFTSTVAAKLFLLFANLQRS